MSNMNYDLYTLVMEMMTHDETATMNWMNNPKDWLDGEAPVRAWEDEEKQRKIISWITEMSKYRA